MDLLATPNTPVLVTGGASGIGAACADALAAVGRPVVLWDLDPQKVQECASRLSREYSVPAVGTVVDVGQVDQYEPALATAREIVGTIGGFVSCAGVVDSTPITESTTQAWQHVIDVNLTAYAFITAALAEDLKSLEGSAVVGISSINALRGQGIIPSYTASKAGMVGLTRSLAAQLGTAQVRVNTVCPGYIETPMLPVPDEQQANPMAELSILKRVGQPEDIADVVRFLLSNQARFITGSTIVADGGVIANDPLGTLA